MKLYHVDAFASKPFGGNPAAVCLLEPGESALDDGSKRKLAAEMNLSETAFPERDEEGAWSIRWFTPAVEVPLCGHATLASAHALFESGSVPPGSTIFFSSLSGTLTARKSGMAIELDFPALRLGPAPESLDRRAIAQALGAAPVEFASLESGRIFLRLASADEVRRLEPDFKAMLACGFTEAIVTAIGDSGDADFVSRLFAPGEGVDEDPVTGSAHCALAPYWGRELGKRTMRGYQASRRGGYVECELSGDRVLLRGEAYTVFRADLYLPG
jgi:PhzF family phenazine biosynthesis protein